MEKSIKRVCKLIEKTGDRVIMFDPETNNPYVIMDLDSYEDLLDQQNGHSGHHNHTKQLEADVQLWKATANEIISPKIEPIKPVETEAEEGVNAEIVEEKLKSLQSEPEESGKKYYFEEVE